MGTAITREHTRYEVKDHVARLALNRPEKKNALNRQMRKEVQAAFLDIKQDMDIWVAIISAEGEVFCSGKDLMEKVDPATDDGTVLSNDDLFLYQRTIYKPIIAALQGPSLAQGAGFALSSDIVIMTERATIGWPQVRRGISSVSGPSQGVHAMPWAVAMSYLLRGKEILARDALRFGLANEVVPQNDLIPTAERWAAEILANAPLAVQGIKEAARRGHDLPLADRMRLARDVADRVLLSQDSKEGVLAFKEKRQPRWTGR